MTLPGGVATQVGAALEQLGLGSRIARATPVGGGCINHGTRIDTERGARLFLKWNISAPAGMFEAEADGLRALRSVEGVRAPEPLAHGADWLLLEHIGTGTATRDTSASLGRMLAALHAAADPPTFGWSRANWIGSLPQLNTPSRSWADFWRDQRIAPQLERARQLGHARAPVFDRVLEVIPAALADVKRPELLHGDLWGGNWLADASGEPWLIDPAVYRGHGEVDLAMSELFGGFERAFYSSYSEARDEARFETGFAAPDGERGRPGAYAAYAEYRRDLYQLHYLLVHVNLFGSSYEAGARAAAERVVAALR